MSRLPTESAVPPPPTEPYRIKMVEPIRPVSRQERLAAIGRAHYNTFKLRSDEVFIDLLTDSGTSAMSDRQWSALMLGDEAYAGSRNFYRLEEVVREIYGFRYVLPTHQGRGAEHLLSQVLIRPGDTVPNNMYFTTTRAHQERAGAAFADIIVDEAHDPAADHPFKGNVDLNRLEALIRRVGPERIPYVSVAVTVNMAGGQPVSLANLRAVRELTRRHGIKVFLDATRCAENAYFIQQREPGYRNRPVREILREMMACADGCTMSGKKDALVNIGGFLACNDETLYQKAADLAVLFEGFPTYGGLAGRDMEAMAQGILEMVDDAYIAHRVEQVRWFGAAVAASGVPIVRPVGGHAVFLDARGFLPHVPQDEFPALALAAALYVHSGVRGMERGVVSAGRDPATGKHRYPRLELVRLTVPRRVYTADHLGLAARACAELYRDREAICGMRFTYEPETLRFFNGRFEPVAESPYFTTASSAAGP